MIPKTSNEEVKEEIKEEEEEQNNNEEIKEQQPQINEETETVVPAQAPKPPRIMRSNRRSSNQPKQAPP
jgi:hypothetical protein